MGFLMWMYWLSYSPLFLLAECFATSFLYQWYACSAKCLRFAPLFFFFCQLFSFIVNIHSSWWETGNFSNFVWLMPCWRDFAKCLGSSVTYIHRGGILLLSIFIFIWLTPYWRDFVKWLASSVTYIRRSGILLPSIFIWLTPCWRDFVKWLASLVTYIRRGKILLPSIFIWLTPC